MAFKPAKLTSIVTKTFSPTEQQVVNLNLVKQGANVKIIAGAGSGKSSSLRYIAENIPEKTFLVLCFNAANAKESNAHPDKPENIFYATLHSLAYRNLVDYKMQKKLSFLNFNQIPEGVGELKEVYKDSKISYVKTKNVLLRAIMDCVVHFCRSDDKFISSFARSYLKYSLQNQEIELSSDELEKVILIVVNYWTNLINKENPTNISHDIYLKMFELKREAIN